MYISEALPSLQEDFSAFEKNIPFAANPSVFAASFHGDMRSKGHWGKFLKANLENDFDSLRVRIGDTHTLS
ncbi:MAG: hypothetical protein Q4B69_01285 [Slackia sp.]|nr:hypothetical protein [Slackia sp.]